MRLQCQNMNNFRIGTGNINETNKTCDNDNKCNNDGSYSNQIWHYSKFLNISIDLRIGISFCKVVIIIYIYIYIYMHIYKILLVCKISGVE
jgi:hypothetical protein